MAKTWTATRRNASPTRTLEPLASRKRGEGSVIPAKQGTETRSRPSSLPDSRIIYCGDCKEQLAKVSPGCIDLVSIDPPINSNRNDDPRRVWGEAKEKRAFEDRHASTQASIDSMRPRCVELARVPATECANEL